MTNKFLSLSLFATTDSRCKRSFADLNFAHGVEDDGDDDDDSRGEGWHDLLASQRSRIAKECWSFPSDEFSLCKMNFNRLHR